MFQDIIKKLRKYGINIDCSSLENEKNAHIKGRNIMETWYYEVVSIDGDYVNLRRTDIESADLKLVARALLPEEISEGSRLKYEMFEYILE